ncbi:MAG: DUF4386 domain-containing protein [Gemmatimonadota bacterium]
MTRTTNARIAGATFLLYIVVGISTLLLSGGASSTAAQLAYIAGHTTAMRFVIVLSMVTPFAALVLAVTLHALTRDQDPDLALLAMTCRIGEGVLNGVFLFSTLGLLWLGTSGGASVPDAASTQALGGFLMKVEGWSPTISATFFAVGSMLFSWLFLRGRMIPAPLAWLGVFASALLVVCLPLQLAGFVPGSVAMYLWLPMLLFEVPLGVWLLIKGVRPTP